MHPERDMGRRIAHNVASASVLDYLELADEHSIVELKSTEKMAGQTIIELDIRAQYGINIIAIKRAKEFIVSPDPNINIEIGDILIMIGHDNDLGRFEKYKQVNVCISNFKLMYVYIISELLKSEICFFLFLKHCNWKLVYNVESF